MMPILHFLAHHPFEFITLLALGCIALWILKGYAGKSISWRQGHKRPVNWMVVAGLAAEIVHIIRGC